MIIAKQKRKENIAEYILYIWQIEDIIRAFDFDINKIEENIISQYNQPEEVKKEIKYWYENLISLMKNEGVAEKGHLQVIKNLISDLTDLHLRLLSSPIHYDYKRLYNEAVPFLAEFHNKSGNKKVSEIELLLNAMYGVLMLKLQKKPVSANTQKAIDKFSRVLALLSKRYKEMESGDLEF